MKLKAVLDKLDGVPDGLRQFYTKQEGGPRDGKFVLDVEEAEGLGLDTATELKQSLSKERKLREDADAALGALKAKFKDIDPDEARAALANKGKGPDLDKAVQKATADAETKFNKERDEFRANESFLVGEVSRLTVESEARAAISKLGGDVELLLPHVLAEVRAEVVEESGAKRYVARVRSKDGAIRLSGKAGNSDPMTVTELVETDLTKRFAKAFPTKSHSGPGPGKGAKRIGLGPTRSDPAGSGGDDGAPRQMTGTERLKLARAAQQTTD